MLPEKKIGQLGQSKKPSRSIKKLRKMIMDRKDHLVSWKGK